MKRFIFLPLIFSIIFVNFCFSQDNNSEIINYSTYCIVNNDGELIKSVSVDVLIKNKKGEQHTEVHIPHTKKEQVYAVKAYLKDQNGKKIRKLKRKEVFTQRAVSLCGICLKSPKRCLIRPILLCILIIS